MNINRDFDEEGSCECEFCGGSGCDECQPEPEAE